MDANYFILFSESYVGIHCKEDTGTDIFSACVVLTFPPRVVKDGDKYHFVTNLSKNGDFNHAIHLFKEAKKKYATAAFLIGYDLDETGDVMAEALRENLISQGVLSKDIFRTPLTEAGYTFVKSFSKTDKYKEYLYLQQQFMKMMRNEGIKKSVGFPKAMSLKYVVKKRGSSITISDNNAIDTNGTSTATVVTKAVTGEE